MSMSSTSVKIDGKLIDNFLKNNGYKITEVSQKMGFEKTYLRKCINRGTMSMSGYKLLCYELQVDKQLFLMREQREEPVIENQAACEIEVISLLNSINKKLDTIINLWN